MADQEFHVYRPSDKLYLAKVTKHNAAWLPDIGKAQAFTQAELLTMAHWIQGCEFHPKRINFMELYYLG